MYETDIIIRMVIVFFGTIGNALSFWIMKSPALKNIPTCFYLSILAIADTGEFIFILNNNNIAGGFLNVFLLVDALFVTIVYP